MAFETPVSAVGVALYGDAGPFPKGGDEKTIAAWIDALPGFQGLKYGSMLLRGRYCTWAGLCMLNRDSCVAAGLDEGMAQQLMFIVRSIGEHDRQAAAVATPSSGDASILSGGGIITARGGGGAVHVGDPPQLPHDEEGGFAQWDSAKRTGGKLAAYFDAHDADDAMAEVTDEVFKNPWTADAATLTLKLAGRRSQRLMFNAVINSLDDEEKPGLAETAPEEAMTERDGVAMLVWWARGCFGEQGESQETEKRRWKKPTPVREMKDVEKAMIAYVKLEEKLVKQKMPVDWMQEDAVAALKRMVREITYAEDGGKPEHVLLHIITDAEKAEMDTPSVKIEMKTLRAKVVSHAKGYAKKLRIAAEVKAIEKEDAKIKGARGGGGPKGGGAKGRGAKGSAAAGSGGAAKGGAGRGGGGGGGGAKGASVSAAVAGSKGRGKGGKGGGTSKGKRGGGKGGKKAKAKLEDQCLHHLCRGDTSYCTDRAHDALDEDTYALIHHPDFAGVGATEQLKIARGVGECYANQKGECWHADAPWQCIFQHTDAAVNNTDAGSQVNMPADEDAGEGAYMMFRDFVESCYTRHRRLQRRWDRHSGRAQVAAMTFKDTVHTGEPIPNAGEGEDKQNGHRGTDGTARVLVDAGANRGLWPKTQQNRLKRLRKLKKKMGIKGFDGGMKAEADATGDWDSEYGRLKQFLVTPGVLTPIVAVRQLTKLGYVYVQNDAGACLLHDTCPDVWLVEENGLYYLTDDEASAAKLTLQQRRARDAMKERVVLRMKAKGRVTCRDAGTVTDTEKAMKAKLAQMAEHRMRGHYPHWDECDDCVRARLTDKAAVRQDPNAEVEGADKGWVTSADLFGPMEEGVNGEVWGMVLVEVKTKWGVVETLKTKEAKGTLAALKKLVVELKARGDPNRMVVRFHSDQGKEFEGVLKKWCEDTGVRKTTTGGYRSKGNTVAERRIRMLREAFRANLLSATGGHEYYHALWGVGAKHANYCVNRSAWCSGVSPYEELCGKEYVWNPGVDLQFGEEVVYHVKAQHREHKGEEPGARGLWMGRSEEIEGGHVVLPLSWNAEAERWVLGASVDCVRARPKRKDAAVYPLRMKKGAPGPDFDSFIDKFDPMMEKMAAAEMLDGIEETEDLGEAEAVWEIEKIVDKRKFKRKVQYLVRWQGYGHEADSWRYVSDLHGAKEAIAEYNGSAAAVKTASVGEVWDEHARAVDHLIRRHSLEGSPEEWREGYIAEYNGVRDKRLEAVSDEVRREVLASGNYVTLRMNPEPKRRTGRKKCRLIAQGFREPHGWDRGSTDAPVAHMCSLRQLVFRGGPRGEQLSAVDIRQAFLQANEFDPSDAPRYVVYAPYRGAEKQVWRLRGALYGTSRSGYRWYETLREWMEKVGFERSFNDPAVFVRDKHTRLRAAAKQEVERGVQRCATEAECRRSTTEPTDGEDEGRLVVACWVDDLLVRGQRGESDAFYDALRERFELKDEPKYLEEEGALDFVGLRLTCVEKGEEMYYYMDQEEDVRDFVEGAGVKATRRVSSPMANKWEIVSDVTPATEEECRWFKSAYGSLSWFMVTTRYDMMYVVHKLGQWLQRPTRGAIKAMRRAVAYLGQTAAFKIGGPRVRDDVVYMACDSDCGGETGTGLGSRSVSARLTLLNQVPVDWASQRQPWTADSPAAAEILAIRAAVAAGRLFMWRARDAAMRVGEQPRVVMHTDSKQGESFAKATCLNTKLGGVFDRKEDWVQELRDCGKVELRHVKSAYNIADIGTKAFACGNFHRLVRLIQGGGDPATMGPEPD